MKLLLSNLREIILALIVIPLLVLGLVALGNPGIADSPTTSTAVSVLVSLLGGIVRFAICAALAWIGLAITFPEANRFIVSTRFDSWWQHLNDNEKARASLLAVAVLVITAALCMAA